MISLVKSSSYSLIDTICRKNNQILESLFDDDTLLEHNNMGGKAQVTQVISEVCKSVFDTIKAKSVKEFKEIGLPASFYTFRENLKDVIFEYSIKTTQIEWYQKYNNKYKTELKKVKYCDVLTKQTLQKKIPELKEEDIHLLSKYIKTLNAEYLVIKQSLHDYTRTLLVIELLTEYASDYGSFNKNISITINQLPSSLQSLLHQQIKEGFKNLGTANFSILKNQLKKEFRQKGPISPYAKQKMIQLLLWAQTRIIENNRPDFEHIYIDDIIDNANLRAINTRYYSLYKSTTLEKLDDYSEYYYSKEKKTAEELQAYKDITLESIQFLEKKALLFNQNIKVSKETYTQALERIKKYNNSNSKILLYSRIQDDTRDYLTKIPIKPVEEFTEIETSAEIQNQIRKQTKFAEYKELIQYIENQYTLKLEQFHVTQEADENISDDQTIVSLTEQFNSLSIQKNIERTIYSKQKPKSTTSHIPYNQIPQASSQQHDRVARWFDLERDPIAEDEKYNNPTDEKFRNRIRAFHNFAQIADGFIEKYGRKKILPSEKYEDSTEYTVTCLFSIDEDGDTTKFFGEISFCVNNALRINWHRYFKPTKKDGLCFNEKMYVLEFPKLEELKNKKVKIKDNELTAQDGSYVKVITNSYVIIHDPKNRATLKLFIDIK